MLRQPCSRRPARRPTFFTMSRPAHRSRLPVAVLTLVAVSMLVLGPPATCRAGDDEGMVTITKNTLYGGILGLILGGTLTLVVDEDSRDDVVRWGIVGGVFAGFGYGLYDATKGDDLLARRRGAPPKEPTVLAAGADRPLAYRLDGVLGRVLGIAPEPS